MPTIRSDFWGNAYTFVRSTGNSSFRKQLARTLNLRQNRKDRQLINVLLGAVAGTTATAQSKRVAHSVLELGGKRSIETETFVNRASTAADDTDLTTALLTYRSQPTSYPVDKATRW